MRAVREFVLDRLYPRAIDGLPALGTPAEFAARFKDDPGSLRERGEQLVLAHIALSSATGFASGLGGWLTLPITLPANIGGVALLQMHMAASVARLAGKDPADELVRSQVFECLIGASPDPSSGPVRDAEQETFDRVGLKLAEKGLNAAISVATGAVRWGARKAVTTAARRRLLRGVPLVGGFIGALSDGYTTRQVARNALDTFLDDGGIPRARPTSRPPLATASPKTPPPRRPPSLRRPNPLSLFLMDPIPTATHSAELKATIDELELGLAQLPLAKAVNRIDDWKREIEATERDDLQPIASGLGELHAALTGEGVNGAMVGAILVRLGKQTEAAADSAEDTLQSSIQRLGSLLRHAGSALAGTGASGGAPSTDPDETR